MFSGSDIFQAPPDPQKENAIAKLVAGLPVPYATQAAQGLKSYPTWFLLRVKNIIWTNSTITGDFGEYYVNQSTIAVDYLATRGVAAVLNHELGHVIYYEVLNEVDRQFLKKGLNLSALEAGIPALVITPTDDEAFAYLNEDYRLGVLNPILSQDLYYDVSTCSAYTIVRPLPDNTTYTTTTSVCFTFPGYMFPSSAQLNRPFLDSVNSFLFVLDEHSLDG